MHQCLERLWVAEVFQDHRAKGSDGITALFDQYLGCGSRDIYHQRPGIGNRRMRHLFYHGIVPKRRKSPNL